MQCDCTDSFIHCGCTFGLTRTLNCAFYSQVFKYDLKLLYDYISPKCISQVKKTSDETQPFHVVPVPVCGVVFHSETSHDLQSVKRKVIKWD